RAARSHPASHRARLRACARPALRAPPGQDREEARPERERRASASGGNAEVSGGRCQTFEDGDDGHGGRRACAAGDGRQGDAQRGRGPFTAAAAELQLEGATTGEQALAVFFAFARQYFEYSALFMVHGDLAAGHDAWGPGATGDKLRAIGVALDLPSALSFAK